MRFQGATVHELARVAELAHLPGETLQRLAERMQRLEISPGEELEARDQFGVVLAGLLSGPRGVLRPGDGFEGRVVATTPATVALCERAVYDELVPPSVGY